MKKSVAVMAVVLGGMVASQAATQYVTNALVSTGWRNVTFTNTVSLHQFNESVYGTLLSVQVNLGGFMTANVVGENGANVGGSLEADLLGNIKSITAGFTTLNAPIDYASGTHVVGANNGGVGPFPTYDSLATPDGLGNFDLVDFGTLTAEGSSTLTKTTGLSAYTGTGNWTMDIRGAGVWGVSGTGDGQTSVADFQGKGEVLVIYGYEAIPEPVQATLLLVGGSMLVLRRRLQKAFGSKVS